MMTPCVEAVFTVQILSYHITTSALTLLLGNREKKERLREKSTRGMKEECTSDVF